MDPLTALQPLGGFGYTYGGFGFGTFGTAAARTSCCPQVPQMPAACCPTTGANPNNKAIQKSLKRMEKQTAKLLKLLMRLMEGKPVKKGKKD